MFYAKSTGGFYDSEIHENNIPNDAVEITENEYAALMAGQSSGKIISAGANGIPMLVDSLQADDETLKAKCKIDAKKRLSDTDFSQIADVFLANKHQFDAYRATVRILFFCPVPNPVWPEIPNPVWKN